MTSPVKVIELPCSNIYSNGKSAAARYTRAIFHTSFGASLGEMDMGKLVNSAVRSATLGALVISLCGMSAAAEDVPCYVQNWKGSGEVAWSGVNRLPAKVPFSITAAQAGRGGTFWYFDHSKDQTGKWWGSITPSGIVSIGFKFANGSRVDGDHFAAILSLRDRRGRIVRDVNDKPAVAEFHAGIDAKGWCHARGKNYKCYKRTKGVRLLLTPKAAASIAFIEHRHGMYDKVDDRIFWKNVRAVAECVAAA